MLRAILMNVVTVLVAMSAIAGEPARIDRAIKKEPTYSSTPKYALLVFGPDAIDRVWLVREGDTLYVDRNGNGDLTEAGEAVAAKDEKSGDRDEDSVSFEVGDLKLGDRVHKQLFVNFRRLKSFTSVKNNMHVRDALKVDPEAAAALINIEVQSARLNGGGVRGRLIQLSGYYDPTGVLQFAGKPADAPTIHFDGPWHICVYGKVPNVMLGRANEVTLAVGTPGVGGGTFALLGYDKAIPEKLYPKVDIHFTTDKAGEPATESYELKERC